MKNFFKYDGLFYHLMNKLGHLILLNIIFFATSLPIITFVSSFSALYYATVKTVRLDNGYPLKEYWGAFKRECKMGLTIGGCLFIITFILVIDIAYVVHLESIFGALSFAVFILIGFVSFAFFIYSAFVLSRFKIKGKKLVKMITMMAFRHLPSTILFMASYILMGILLLLLPVPLMFFLPSITLYLLSFIVERILKQYMEFTQEEEVEKWYLQL